MRGSRLYEFAWLNQSAAKQTVMPDDHSKVAPLLPIPNRTVKRLCADDSADSRVKVGHRQALIPQPPFRTRGGGLCSRCLSAEVFASLLMGGLQRHSELCHNARLC